jgi:hypothetical protein
MQNIKKNNENNVIKIVVLVKYNILKNDTFTPILLSHLTDLDHIYIYIR